MIIECGFNKLVSDASSTNHIQIAHSLESMIAVMRFNERVYLMSLVDIPKKEKKIVRLHHRQKTHLSCNIFAKYLTCVTPRILKGK